MGCLVKFRYWRLEERKTQIEGSRDEGVEFGGYVVFWRDICWDPARIRAPKSKYPRNPTEMQSTQQGLTRRCAFLPEHHIFVPSGKLT